MVIDLINVNDDCLDSVATVDVEGRIFVNVNVPEVVLLRIIKKKDSKFPIKKKKQFN